MAGKTQLMGDIFQMPGGVRTVPDSATITPPSGYQPTPGFGGQGLQRNQGVEINPDVMGPSQENTTFGAQRPQGLQQKQRFGRQQLQLPQQYRGPTFG